MANSKAICSTESLVGNKPTIYIHIHTKDKIVIKAKYVGNIYVSIDDWPMVMGSTSLATQRAAWPIKTTNNETATDCMLRVEYQMHYSLHVCKVRVIINSVDYIFSRETHKTAEKLYLDRARKLSWAASQCLPIRNNRRNDLSTILLKWQSGKLVPSFVTMFLPSILLYIQPNCWQLD